MEQEYLSIKEFASLAGVSQQAIYKRLANPSDELCRFLIELDGKKRLEVSALDFFIHASNSTGNSTGCSTGCSTVETKLIDLLQEELKQKNEQISNLQKLLHQEQQLHLLTRQELLALTAPQQPEPDQAAADTNDGAPAAADTVSPEQPPEQMEVAPELDQRKKRWWQLWKK